jgi:serine/threonine protein kinase
MNIDVRRDKRPLFQTFGKRIYKAEWITQAQRPPVIILQIDGARAQKEASFYVKLSRHPHIVRTYGLVEDVIPSTTSVMLLQEYAPEGSLFEFLTDQQELPNDKIFEEMFIQIADAMVFLGKKMMMMETLMVINCFLIAHNQIVHGDLACRNVLIFRYDPNDTKRNMVKLTDFGLSRFSSIYSSVLGAISTTTIHVSKVLFNRN